ncbi:MAG: chromosome segregation protein SMC [Anaerolineales bacterium]|nr:chromosome segregation protein SMC [Anaerolineales bacterium]MDW8161013.1 chromosome segregation protein SMC [Anaerolineales bacterium]
MALRLKSLELQGYKTFASKTLFVFSGSVTAIVGPNGSGKSNIADAIRWVLGEQSYALLRGRRTEDMIFSGSDLRARAGMAQATMVFDNLDQWMPIEFSEVAITRRAYRDGQNEYLINGQRVRLKDVNELLARSGLSGRTYTVIGQGLVDGVLALKAEDRRQLFEEAAGVGVYRSRREEALRRLESTRRNLERVYDLLSEIEPRLRSLEKQVKRLEEYEQIRSELKKLLLEWYGFHWHQEQKQFALQKEFVEQRENAVEESQQQLLRKERELTSLREHLLARRRLLEQLRQELNHLAETRHSVNRQLAVLGERKDALRLIQVDLEAQRTRLMEEEEELSEKVREAQAEQAVLQEEYRETVAKVEAARRELAHKQKEYEDEKVLLDDLSSQLNLLVRQRAELEARLQQVIRQQKQRAELARAKREELVRVETTLRARSGTLEDLRSSLNELREELAFYQQRLEELQADEQRDLELRKRKQEHRTKLESERMKLFARLSVLEQADQALTDYSQAVQYLFRRKDQGLAILGVLGSMLDVPAKFEVAVAAYLGEMVDTILTPDLSTAESLAKLLAQENLRGVFLPLHERRNLPELPAFSQEGVIGWLKDLVSIEPRYRDVLERIFYRVLLVENTEVAKVLHQTLSDPPILVTLNGELYFPQGLIASAGKIEAGKLRRPREKREIRRQIALLDLEIEALDRELAALDQQIVEVGTSCQAMRKEQARVRESVAVVEQRLTQLTQEIEKDRVRQEILKKHLEELEEEGRVLDQEICVAELKQEELGRQVPLLETQIREQSQRLSEIALDQFQRRVAQWEAYLEAMERALDGTVSKIKERVQQREMAKQALNHVGAKHRETEEQLVELEAALAQLRNRENQIEQAQSDLIAKIEPLRMEIEELESQMEALRGEVQDLQRTLQQQEHNLAQLRVTLARQQERLEAWRQKIEEDFGLVAFDYGEEISGPRPLPIDGMVETLPRVSEIHPDLEEQIRRYRGQLRRLGAVSPEARVEYEQVKQRYQFMQEQIADLLKAEEDVLEILHHLDETIEQDFLQTYEAVAEEFRSIFARLFRGGSARLFLTDGDELLNAGIEIEVRLPGKRAQGLSLLSGGERSLAAVALIFALLKVSPAPFCVLDEVDAMLDEANIARFQELLKELSETTQFILVTHNRHTVQVAEIIYGVTLGRDSTSQVISLKLDELDRVMSPG